MMRKRITAAALILLLLLMAGCVAEQAANNGKDKAPPSQTTTNDSSTQPIPLETNQPREVVAEEDEVAASGEEVKPIATSSENSFILHSSRDFGRETLNSRPVKLQSSGSLLDYMQEEWQVKTGFGGGFVQGIDGLESANSSGNRYDWFFYVNGIVAPVGADQIKPSSGHIIWWDYHRWSSGPGQSAIIGCYPQPLKDKGVTLLTTQRWTQLALQCQKAMGISGISSVEILDIGQNMSRLDNPTAPVMIIGTWTELQENTYLKKWNESYRRNGSSVHFTDNGLDLLGVDGQVQRTLGPGAGVIVASGKGLGDNNPLWLIAGVDDQGVKEAAQLLCAQPDELAWKCGLAVQTGQITALPVD